MRMFQQATAGIHYHPRGVMFSEMYLFSRTCQAMGVEMLAESGVAGGVSTRILRALGWPLASFDKVPSVIPPDLQAVVTIADGRKAIPEWVEAHQTQRLGILLDGPKGPKAERVRRWCLTRPNVRVVAQHDTPRGSGEDIHSRDEAWSETAPLDAGIPAEAPVRASSGLGIWLNPVAWP